MKTRIFILFSLLAVGFFFYLNGLKEKEIASRLKSDLKKSDMLTLAVPEKKNETLQDRVPASISRPSLDKKDKKEREIIGINREDFLKQKDSIVFINEVDQKWKEKLTHKLTRFQKKTTKVETKHLKSLLKVKNNRATYFEVVLVTYRTVDGHRSSFNAMVDSQTARVVKSWNLDKPEKREKISLTPTNL